MQSAISDEEEVGRVPEGPVLRTKGKEKAVASSGRWTDRFQASSPRDFIDISQRLTGEKTMD